MKHTEGFVATQKQYWWDANTEQCTRNYCSWSL